MMPNSTMDQFSNFSNTVKVTLGGDTTTTGMGDLSHLSAITFGSRRSSNSEPTNVLNNNPILNEHVPLSNDPSNLGTRKRANSRDEFQSLYMNRSSFIRAQPTFSSSSFGSKHGQSDDQIDRSSTSPNRVHTTRGGNEKSILQDSVVMSLSMADRRSYELKIRELERRNAELSEMLVVTKKNEQHAKSSASNESELNRQLREINQRLSATVSTQIHQMDTLDREITSKVSLLESKQSMILGLEKKIEELSTNKSEELNDLKKKLKRASIEIQKLRQSQSESKVDEYQQSNMLEEKNNAITQLKQSIESLKFSNENLESRIARIQEENTTLRNHNMNLADETARAKIDREQIQHQLTQAQEEFKEFEKEFDKIKTKYDEFLITYTTMLEDNKTLKKEISKKERRIESLEEHVALQTKDQNYLYHQIEVLKEQQQELILIQEEKKRKEKYRTMDKYEAVVHRNAQKGDARGSKSPVYLISPQRESSRHEECKRSTSPAQTRCEQLADGVSDDQSNVNSDSSVQDAEYIKKRLLTERKRVELKNIEIAGLKEMLYQSMKSNENNRPLISNSSRSQIQHGEYSNSSPQGSTSSLVDSTRRVKEVR